MKLCRGLMMAGAWTLAWVAGVSAQTNVPPRIPAAAATNYLNQEVIVTDRVAQVTLRPTIVFLNLNQRYPDSPLTCVIKGSDTNNFPDLKSYQDKEVEVSGRITDFQGKPEIVLTTTNQIKILADTQSGPQSNPPVVQPITNEARLLPPAPARPAAKTAQPMPRPTVEAAQTPVQIVWWIVGSLTVIIALSGFLVFLFWRKGMAGSDVRAGHSLSTLPALTEGVAADSLSAEDWKQRALVAEAMAGRQGQMLREKIMPELAEFAKQSLVQGLYAQRNALMERQQKAQHALTEFESRLAALQLPFQERIRAYEKRIVELEKEVGTQGEEMRELTYATLVLVRKKLEDEREYEHTRGRFN
ncbi:MAG: hypothetical protein WBN75_05740 [Verrucomicrobiia bacterium]